MGSVQEKPLPFLSMDHWRMTIARMLKESERRKEAAPLDGENGESVPDGQKKNKKASN